MAFDPFNNPKDDEKGNPYDVVASYSGTGEKGFNPGAQIGVANQQSKQPGQTAAFGGALPGGDSGPSATGYVNFDRLYNANADVATREAGSRANQVDTKGKAAQQGLAGAQGKFNAGVAGASSSSPDQSMRDWAAYGSTGVQQPKKVTGAYDTGADSTGARQSNVLATTTPKSEGWGEGTGTKSFHDQDVEAEYANHPVQQSYTTEQQDGLDSGGYTRDSGPTTAPEDFLSPEKQAELDAAVHAGAAREYTGPTALSAMDEYEKLAQDTAAAQQAAQNPLTGMNSTDSALLGAAGRPRFAELESKYGHLNDTLQGANTASAKTAAAAKAKADADRLSYEGLINQYEGRAAGDKATADAANASSDRVLKGATNAAAERNVYDNFLHGGDALDKTRNGLHTIARTTSPSEQATGGKGLAALGTNAIDPQGADNQGNKWSGWSDDDGDVYSSMSQSDWDTFAGMSDSEKRAWIEARKAQIRGGG